MYGTSAGVPALVQVVDDDPITQMVIGKIIKKLGVVSIAAQSIQEARDQLANCPVDMMVMDGWLPDGVAFDLLEHVRMSLPHMDMPVVFCSSDPASHERHLDGLGVHAVLSKPVNAAEFREACRGALRRATLRWEPPRVAADRLGISQVEFDQMLRLVHRELTDLHDELAAAATSGDRSGSDLRPLVQRVHSAALNVGAAKLARGISMLNVEDLSAEELQLAADMIRVEINVKYGPFRGIVREAAMETA